MGITKLLELIVSKKPYIYAAHPISRTKTKFAWQLRQEMERYKIRDLIVYDPETLGLKDESSPDEIVTANKLAILNCKFVVADYSEHSVGVCMETIYANENKKRVYAVSNEPPVSAWFKTNTNLVFVDLNGLIKELVEFGELHV